MRTLFRKSIPVLAIFMVSLLAGCTPDPNFTPPIRWESQQDSVSMSIQLNEDGSGYAQNAPVGIAQEGQYAGGCLNDTGERYTGQITWRAVSQYGLEISFPDSKYILGTGPGKFGSQDWSEVRIGSCGDAPPYWPMYAVCGNTGIEYYDDRLPSC